MEESEDKLEPIGYVRICPSLYRIANPPSDRKACCVLNSHKCLLWPTWSWNYTGKEILGNVVPRLTELTSGQSSTPPEYLTTLILKSSSKAQSRCQRSSQIQLGDTDKQSLEVSGSVGQPLFASSLEGAGYWLGNWGCYNYGPEATTR